MNSITLQMDSKQAIALTTFWRSYCAKHGITYAERRTLTEVHEWLAMRGYGYRDGIYQSVR